MRLIDANLAMRKIREYMEDYPNATARLAACRACLSILGDKQQVPTIDPESLRPRWIPVTERMPVEAKKVLCFLALSGGPMVETGYYMGDEGWYYTGIEAPHHGIVTHWMPLPEPPEVSDH